MSGSPQLPSPLPDMSGSPQLSSVAPDMSSGPRVSPYPQPPSVPDMPGAPVSQEIQTSNPLGQLEQQLVDILRAWLHQATDNLTPPLVTGQEQLAAEVPPPTMPQPSGVGERSLMCKTLAIIGCAAATFALQIVAKPTDGVFSTLRLHACHCTGEGETQICPSPYDCIPITYIGFQLATTFTFSICGCLLAQVIWGLKKFRGWMLLLLLVWTFGYVYAAFARSPRQFWRYTVIVEFVTFPVVIVVMVLSCYMKRMLACFRSLFTDSPALPV